MSDPVKAPLDGPEPISEQRVDTLRLLIDSNPNAEPHELLTMIGLRDVRGLIARLDALNAAALPAPPGDTRERQALQDIAERSTDCRFPGCDRRFCEHYIAGISPHDFAAQALETIPAAAPPGDTPDIADFARWLADRIDNVDFDQCGEPESEQRLWDAEAIITEVLRRAAPPGDLVGADELRAALREIKRFATHASYCEGVTHVGSSRCTCGFENAMKDANAALDTESGVTDDR